MNFRVDERVTPRRNDRFIDRCKALGLPTWWVDAEGRTIESPTGWGPPDHWLKSPLLAKWVRGIVAGNARRTRVGAIELFSGCMLIPIQDSDDSPPTTTVVMALSPEALEAEQFVTICNQGHLDVSIARTAMAPLARWRRADSERLTRILRWFQEDLRQNDGLQELMTGFSEQLTAAYEQLTHLYEISRAINRLSEPDDFARMACDRLHQSLSFKWTVIVALPRTTASEVLTQTTIVSGDLPFERRRLVARLERLHLKPDDERILLDPKDDTIAKLANSEVVIEPIVSGEKVVGAVMAGGKTGSDVDVSSIDFLVVRATAEYLGSFFHSVASFQEQRTMFLGTIRAITYTIEAKDRYTRGHSERVAHLAAQLAAAAGVDPATVPRIRLAGMLHDVGKIGVPETVLRKPGKLSDDEFDAIKRHPIIGYTILRDIGPLHDILPGVLHHHERWDGAGYPQGLAGTRIPYLARILAVADTFDAMCSERTYRSARPRTKVMQEMQKMAGTQLDPDLTRVFLTLDHREYDAMIARHLAHDQAVV